MLSHSLRNLAICLLALLFQNAIVSVNCGRTRMAGGTEISIENVPYLIQFRDSYGDVFCGGALVSPEYVITAAHCFNDMDYKDVTVVGGSSTMGDESGVQRKIASVVLHPEYGLYTMHSDAAVVRLDRPMSGDSITSIPLCRQPVREGNLLQVSGWGRVDFDGIWDRKLRTATFPVRAPEVCKKEFGDFMQKNMFCASGIEAKGICFGDSGGPAVYGGQLCGVVAYAFKCGKVGYTSGFTDVYAVRSFLENSMRN